MNQSIIKRLKKIDPEYGNIERKDVVFCYPPQDAIMPNFKNKTPEFYKEMYEKEADCIDTQEFDVEEEI